MRDTMLRQQRNESLFKTYQNALVTNSFSNQREAVDYVRTHPAPKWFVSKEFCAAVISSRLRGTEYCKMRRLVKKKFDALFDLYMEKKKEFPYCGYCHLALCEAIVEMPAPEWYIGSEMASRIISEQIRKKNNQVARKYGR